MREYVSAVYGRGRDTEAEGLDKLVSRYGAGSDADASRKIRVCCRREISQQETSKTQGLLILGSRPLWCHWWHPAQMRGNRDDIIHASKSHRANTHSSDERANHSESCYQQQIVVSILLADLLVVYTGHEEGQLAPIGSPECPDTELRPRPPFVGLTKL